jgi:hypothetical protein
MAGLRYLGFIVLMLEKVVGPHLKRLITGSKLYKKNGKYVEVEPFYQRALAIYTKVSGDENTNVALVLKNLAELYLYE